MTDTDQGDPSGSEAQSGATPEDEDLDLEYGRWLFAQECRFMAGVAEMWQLPEFDHAEIAFAGRSNVGKSSLINALTGQKTLARTSNTPGRTKQLNFFELGGRLMLVDLPGYGYAKASKTEILRWTVLTNDFLKGRPTLRRVCLLVDARRGVQDADRAVMKDLDRAAVSYQVVLTKCDKVSGAELEKVHKGIADLRRKHIALHPVVRETSSLKERGIADLRAELAMFANSA